MNINSTFYTIVIYLFFSYLFIYEENIWLHKNSFSLSISFSFLNSFSIFKFYIFSNLNLSHTFEYKYNIQENFSMRCLFYLFIYLTNIILLFEYAQNQEISNGFIIPKPYILIFYLFILFFFVIQILGSTCIKYLNDLHFAHSSFLRTRGHHNISWSRHTLSISSQRDTNWIVDLIQQYMPQGV
jgi:hypothetical protein